MTQTAASTSPSVRGSAKMKHPFPDEKSLVDLLSFATVMGTLADVLPSVAALFTIIWTSFRIYETDTVQGWIEKKDKS